MRRDVTNDGLAEVGKAFPGGKKAVTDSVIRSPTTGKSDQANRTPLFGSKAAFERSHNLEAVQINQL
jgi:hypothetical protein